MGGGASSLIRLRKALVIRAYNLRQSEQTLDEQFRPLAVRLNGVLYIRLEDVSNHLCMDTNGAWMEELFRQIMVDGSKDKRMRFHDFVEFLETGKVVPVEVVEGNLLQDSSSTSPKPEVVSTIKSVNYNSSMSNLLKANKLFQDSSTSGGASTTNARVDRALRSSSSGIETQAPPFPPSEAEEPSSPQGSPKVELGDTLPNPKSLKPTVSMELILKGSHRMTAPTDLENKIVKPLWKKREVMKQERTIHYTTVDASGQVQELVEKEVSETEVLHMECRETGEFAHRETTLYEQRETFNDEVVNEQIGTEEYVHMKSQDDEYEYRDSNMPPRGAPPESAPMSPDGHGGGEHGEHNTGGAGCTPKSSPPGGDGHGHGVVQKDEDYDSDGESIRATATGGVGGTGQQYAGGSFSPDMYARGKSDGLREGAEEDIHGELSRSGDEEDIHPYQHDSDANASSAADSYRSRYKRSNATPTSDISGDSSGAPTPAVNVAAGVGAYMSNLDLGADESPKAPKPSKPKRSGSGVRFSCEDEADQSARRSYTGSRGDGSENVDNYANRDDGCDSHHDIPSSPERKQKLSSLFTDEGGESGCAGSGSYVHGDAMSLGANADLLGAGSEMPPRSNGKIPMSPKVPRSPKTSKAPTPVPSGLTSTGGSMASMADSIDSEDAPPLIRQTSSMHEID